MVKSLWTHPDGSISRVYLLIAGIAVGITLCTTVLDPEGIKWVILFLAPGLIVASLVKHIEWQDVMLDKALASMKFVAGQPCKCNPEYDGYECHVCLVRGVLRETFPESLPKFMP
jgi:hypothetical protein